MGFHGDLLPDQAFPAQQDGAAAVLGEKAVVIPSATAQTAPSPITGDAGQDSKIDLIRMNVRAVRRRFWNPVGAWEKLLQSGDLTRLHVTRFGAPERDELQ